MIDFSNPLLTNQQKQSILCSIAQGHDLKSISHADRGHCAISFASYWVLKMHDLWELNRKARSKLKSMFLFDQDRLETCNPTHSVIIFESDRVEKGEWDNFMNQWELTGYQNTLVLGIDAEVHSVHNNFVAVSSLGSYAESSESAIYRNTQPIHENKPNLYPLGILDIPLDDLAEYDHKRCFERISGLSNHYKSIMQVILHSSSPLTRRGKRSHSPQHNSKGFGRN